jgi:hypothetical protein
MARGMKLFGFMRIVIATYDPTCKVKIYLVLEREPVAAARHINRVSLYSLVLSTNMEQMPDPTKPQRTTISPSSPLCVYEIKKLIFTSLSYYLHLYIHRALQFH